MQAKQKYTSPQPSHFRTSLFLVNSQPKGVLYAEHFIYLPIPSKRHKIWQAISFALAKENINEMPKIMAALRFTTKTRTRRIRVAAMTKLTKFICLFAAKAIHFRGFSMALERVFFFPNVRWCIVEQQ